MAAWDNIKDSFYSAGKDISQKAKDVSEVARLKLDIRAKEEFLEKQYAAIGKAYYESHKDSEEMLEAEAAEFRTIEEALLEISRMKEAILNIQGSVECPNCHVIMPEHATYCSNCGTKMEDIYEEE